MPKAPEFAYLSLSGGVADARNGFHQIASRYFSEAEYALQNKALVAGMRAYVRILLRAARRAAYDPRFKKADGYRSAVRRQSKWMVRAYFYAGGGYGNILEAGSDSHWAPLADTLITKGKMKGESLPGVAQWLRKHAPEVLAAMSPKARFIKVAARTGRPWVIPAAEASEQESFEAFRDRVVDTIIDEIG